MLIRNTIIKKLARAIHVHPAPPESILSAEKINQLFIEARQAVPAELKNIYSQPGLHGHKLSYENGQGMDYNESRLYSSGDDYRSINWKQSARSDQLIVNQFSKEQEPVDYILLDTRPSMYFGTKKQTKISNAIKLVIESITASLKYGHTVKLFSFDDNIQQLGWVKDFRQAFNIVSELANYDEKDTPPNVININKAIQSLVVVKPEYSSITIISDFNDMSESVSISLNSFREKNNIMLYPVKDEIELDLPAIHPVDYQSLNKNITAPIDTATNAKDLRKQLIKRNKSIFSLLKKSADNVVLVTNDSRQNLSQLDFQISRES